SHNKFWFTTLAKFYPSEILRNSRYSSLPTSRELFENCSVIVSVVRHTIILANVGRVGFWPALVTSAKNQRKSRWQNIHAILFWKRKLYMTGRVNVEYIPNELLCSRQNADYQLLQGIGPDQYQINDQVAQ